jgi:hypothetical protein
MARISLDKFVALVTESCSTSRIVERFSIIRLAVTWLKIRAHMVDDSFLDASYNKATGKTTYAHICNTQRVFGADNKNAWHWHPYEDPKHHDFTNREITFAEFLERVEENLSK